MERRQLLRGIALGVVLCLGPGAVKGQVDLASVDRPVLIAQRTEVPPELDGNVAGDPAWQGVAPATGFVQNTPDEGEPASERTEVFVTYDDTTLYLGVVCYDSDPEAIIIADSRRDASLDETDSFQIIFDTYADGQSGFVFGTNPAGIEFDGQVAGASSSVVSPSTMLTFCSS